MPTVSIIVPIYNVEQYLRRCVDSIVNQTYKNIEIVLVNDGSTDGSGIICDEYAKNDNRVRVYHKKNGGAASARNLGLNHAKGEFIGFVDSDDYIDLDMYETLLQFMEDDVDIVTCGNVLENPYDKFSKKRVTSLVHGGQKYNREHGIEQLLLDKAFSFSQCDKLFRKRLFDNIRYPIGRISEDLPVIFTVFMKSRKIAHCGKVKYHYVYREDSISHRPFFFRRIDNTIFSARICKEVSKVYPNMKELAEAFYWKNVVKMIRYVIASDNREEYDYLERKLKREAIVLYIHNINNKYIEKEHRKIFWKSLKDKNVGV